MDEELCTYCQGTGECLRPTSTNPNDGGYEHATCPACHGSGFKPRLLKPRGPARKYKKGEHPAIKAAVAAVEKFFGKGKK